MYKLKKKHLDVINLNLLFAKSYIFLNSKDYNYLYSFGNLALKTDLYILLKELKMLKCLQFDEIVDSNLALHLQVSKIFYSLIEKENVEYSEILRKKLRSIYVRSLYDPCFFMQSSSTSISCKPEIFLAYNSFSTKNCFIDDSRYDRVLPFLKRKNFLHRVYLKRFIFRLDAIKKNYRFVSSSSKRRIGFLKATKLLICINRSYFLRYLKDKKQVFSLFKKLVWIRRKRTRRKWQNSFIFRFYRSRYRLFYKFYIPKYLEINYNTLSYFHLGLVDFSSVDSKIPFWINIRRLLTRITY